MSSNNSDTNLFLILENYLRPFQQWMSLSSPNHSANKTAGTTKNPATCGEEGHSSNENA